jgi:sugar phosphate isomerase/epimerase
MQEVADQAWTRRKVLKSAGAIVVGAFAATAANGEPAAAPAAKTPPLVRIGIFLSTFRGATLEAKLDGVKANGLDCVQLGMECAGLPPMPDAIPAELLARIKQQSADRGIEIASIQGTFNMCHPDADFRQGGVRRIGVLAAACNELGVPRIHLCTGTRDRVNMWRRHPKNDSPDAWTDMVATIRAAVDVATPHGVTLAFEPEVNNVVDSAKKARKLLDEIDSPLLKVTMDGSNLFHAGEFARMDEILDESFALVGKDIVMAHAKDVSHDGDAGHEPAGHGKLHYSHYVALLHKSGMKGPLLLHGLSEAQVPECVAFLRGKIAQLETH